MRDDCEEEYFDNRQQMDDEEQMFREDFHQKTVEMLEECAKYE